MGNHVLRELYDQDPILYSPITNKETIEKATAAVNTDPVAARVRLMADAPLNPDTMVNDIAEGIAMMRKAATSGDVIELRDLSKQLAKKYTPVAQTLQLASTIDKLSPEGLFVYMQRLLNQAAE